MKCTNGKKLLLSTLLASLVTACGSSSDSDDSSFADAYIQLYNGSANSALTYISVDDVMLSGSSYGDVTSVYSYESGEVNIQLSRMDSDGVYVDVLSNTLDIKDGEKSIVLLTGDYDSPSVTVHQIERREYEDEFDLFVTSADSSEAAYDLYMAEAGVPFESANLVANIEYQGLEQGKNWEQNNDDNYWNTGNYVFYITLAGDDAVLFESGEVDLDFSTEYVAVIRSDSDLLGQGLILDFIYNSSNVGSYIDVNQSAQFRVYNSYEQGEVLSASLWGNGGQPIVQTIEPGSLSEFKELDFGDYQLSVAKGEQNVLENNLLTLNQGEIKTVLLFDDAEGEMTSLTYNESKLPQLYEHELNIANLTVDYDDVDVYFVRQSETVESAQYKVTNLDFGEIDTLTIPSGFFEMVAVYEKDDENSKLLYRSALLEFNEERNYIVTLEKDNASSTGYVLRLPTE